jgi:hypothetical protein
MTSTSPWDGLTKLLVGPTPSWPCADDAAASTANSSTSTAPPAVTGTTAPEKRLFPIVEVTTTLGLPLPALSAVAVAALTGPLNLGGGPLEADPDFIGLQLGNRALVTLGDRASA